MGKTGRLLFCVILMGICDVVGAQGVEAAFAQIQRAEPGISYIVLEAKTGSVLLEHNADQVRAPASMVKMMQMLLVAEGIEEGRWSLDTELVASKRAADEWGSSIYLTEGEVWTLDEIMQAVAVRSANDGSVMVAENLWGSVENYLARMNERARELGMIDTEFFSVNGLPPRDEDRPNDRTTARDMAILAQWCVTHPIVMEWAGKPSLNISKRRNDTRSNTNRLLWQLEGCDGLKTGYTRAAGFCLAATAERDGVRLITVVMGFDDADNRFSLARYALERGFGMMQRVRLFAQGELFQDPIPVRNSERQEIGLVAAEDLWVTAPAASIQDIEIIARTPRQLRAPLQSGAVVGEVRVQLNGTVLAQTSLCVDEPVEEASWRWKLKNSIMRGFQPSAAMGVMD